MPLFICYVIAYIQILSAGFNLWGVDPQILVNAPVGRNTFFVGFFLLVQILGLTGAVLMLQKMRLGFVLSIVHHILLLPALLITSWGLVMLMDDRLNATLLFMSKPTGAEVGFYWSLGWSSVFQQVTRNVATGSSYFGINLFAFVCATVLWVGMDETDTAKAEREMQMRRRQRQGKRPLALPAPQSNGQRMHPQQQRAHPQQQRAHPQQQRVHPQQPRMNPQQGVRQPPRMPPRERY
jgi:hypothetical protein